MHAFSKELYDTMGVWVFILSCYLKPDSYLDVSTHDFNQELGNGKDYLDIHGWSFQEEGISVSSWRAHNEEYYGSEDLTGAKGGHQGSRAANILEKNQYGEPVLPDPSKPPVKSAWDVRIWRLNVLRSFVNQHYSKLVFREFPSSFNVSNRSGSWTD
jgi:hypothetical protein